MTGIQSLIMQEFRTRPLRYITLSDQANWMEICRQDRISHPETEKYHCETPRYISSLFLADQANKEDTRKKKVKVTRIRKSVSKLSEQSP